MANVNFDGREESGAGRYLGKGPMLCRADGCQCWAQTGTRGVGNDPDVPGLCQYHGAVEDNPEAWPKMTDFLQMSQPVRRLVFLCSQLEKFPIDRDARTKMDGSLVSDSEWRRLRWEDTDYLTMKTQEWLDKYSDFFGFGAETAHRRIGQAAPGCEFWEAKDYESPKAYGIRVHHALIGKLVEWSLPKNRPAATNIPNAALLQNFFERNRSIFSGGARK